VAKPGVRSRRGGADEVVTVDTHELRELITRLRDVQDRKLKAALRQTLRESADIAVKGVREEVLKPPPEKIDTRTLARLRRKRATGRARSSGLRADIAQATKASITRGTDKRGGQVSIVAADARLSARHKGMAKAYNAGEFRHPTWGNRDKWVPQRGQRNYFGKGVAGRREDMMRRLRAAMDDVTKNL
jgi:hypothetical protein